MQEMDMLNRLFRDEPINEDSLQQMKMGIMNQILAKPMDFQAKILRTQRRKWGLLLLALFLFAGIGFFSLIWFEGNWLVREYINILSAFMEDVKAFGRLRVGLELLWQQYVWSFLGIAFSWVLFDGIHHKMFIKD
ncbi:hypothetical protein ACHOLT_01585 [Desulfitobacterium sp. Sab5]|uniref:hypothetical protein n=1 Tax=Desulfitobacterium nosdiversum TaxID=3375356 RepID=UPI003CEC68AB